MLTTVSPEAMVFDAEVARVAIKVVEGVTVAEVSPIGTVPAIVEEVVLLDDPAELLMVVTSEVEVKAVVDGSVVLSAAEVLMEI